jgi:hypothetical protein
MFINIKTITYILDRFKSTRVNLSNLISRLRDYDNFIESKKKNSILNQSNTE